MKNWSINNWSLDNKLWLCALSPSIIACTVLVWVFGSAYYRQLEEVSAKTSYLIAQNLVDIIQQHNQPATLLADALEKELERQLIEHHGLRGIQLIAGQQLLLHQGAPFIDDGYQTPALAQNSFIQQDSVTHYALGNNTSRITATFTGAQGEALNLSLIFDHDNIQVAKFRLALKLALACGLILVLTVIMFASLKRMIVRPFTVLRDNLERLSHGDTKQFVHEEAGQPFDLLFKYMKRTSERIDATRKERQQTEFRDQQQDLRNRNIEKSSNELLMTITNLFDVSTSETGQVILDHAPFNLDEVTEGCIELFTKAAREKDLRLMRHIDRDTPRELLGDPIRLQQIFSTIIGIAVHTFHHGDIVIDISSAALHSPSNEENPSNKKNQSNEKNQSKQNRLDHDDKVDIEFKIQVPGKDIDAGKQHPLIAAFSHTDSSTDFGLSTCKGLVKLMQGKIGIDSNDGAIIWLKIPLAVNKSAMPNTSPLPQSKPRFQADVLAVDDNPANLQLLSELLQDFGVTVHLANNGMEALAQCEQRRFDLIFMDIQMPVIDGMETTRRIRRLEQIGDRTPIVALTAHAITDQKTSLLVAGLDDYLSKPINHTQLLHLLRRWVGEDNFGEKQLDEKKLREKQLSENRFEQQQDLPNTPPGDKPATVSPVNINLSLQLSNNKASLARDLLAMLLKELPKQRAEIITAQMNKDLATLETVIHKIRGGTSYCGTPQLKTSSAHADELLRKRLYDDAAIAAVLADIDVLLSWIEDIDIDALFGLEAVH